MFLDKDFIPIWCKKCNHQGVIFVYDAAEPAFVLCKTCNWETSETWCPKCDMGGSFIEEIDKRPENWSCPTCKTLYQLPHGFYNQSVELIDAKDLPEDVRQKIFPIPKADLFNKIEDAFRFLSTIVSFVGLFISVALHFMLLVNNVRYEEVEKIVYIGISAMVILNYHRVSFYFRRLPWQGKIISAAILCYGFWYLFTGPSGSLDELPTNLREISAYHQSVFIQSLMITGYTFFCFYWFYLNQEYSKNNIA